MEYIALNHKNDFAKIPIIVFTANSSNPAEKTIPSSVKKNRKPFELDVFLQVIEAEFQSGK